MPEASSGKRAHEQDKNAGSSRKRRRSRFSTVDANIAAPSSDKGAVRTNLIPPVAVRPAATTHVAPHPVGRQQNGWPPVPQYQPPNGAPSRTRRWSSAPASGVAFDIASIPVAPVTTLRINRDAAIEKRVKGALKLSDKDLLDENPETNPNYDANITINTAARRPARSSFNFIEQGAIVARADKLRARAEDAAITKMYREKIAEKAARNSAIPEIPPYIEKRQPHADGSATPAVEWWDEPFVDGDAYALPDADGPPRPEQIALRESKLNALVHHPRRITPSVSDRPPPVLPLMLTEKERKRLRRQRRQRKNRDAQEMIAVGLMPAPPPKVKLSNMMRVLAEEVTADPTRLEMQVREQVAARKAKHEEDNEMRRCTKEERREKGRQKEEKDRAAGLFANVYRVSNAQNAQHRFKVVMNARQLGLSGALVLFHDCNVVVVEGGAKTLAKFRKLMLRRIDWSVLTPPSADGAAASDASAGVDGATKKNEAVLVWEGAVRKTSFQEFRTVETKSEAGCRQFFRKRRVEHYWDLCVQASPPGDTTLGVRNC